MFPANIQVHAETSPQTIRNISITIAIYDESYNAFTQWITPYLDFHNFTFLISPHAGSYDWYLNNKTRVDFVTAIGEAVPMTPFAIQQYSPIDRISLFNNTLHDWNTSLGCLPDGVFMFQPDTCSLNYLKSCGVNYSMGYCFDQYLVDYMSMRGGWQLPYYAYTKQAIMPENTTEGGMVVLPWLTWDWIDSFKLSHLYESETMGCAAPNSTEYVTDLLERTADSCSPFGYAAFSFDFDWYYNKGEMVNATKALSRLLADDSYQKYSCGNFTRWFKAYYPSTPNYSINFTSPNSNESVEWFYCKDFRVTRVNQTVVCYVDYTGQQPDKYLTSAANVNWTQPKAPLNCIDTSLTFAIDALGGGQYRAPVVGSGMAYSGLLSDFQRFFTIPEFSTWTICIMLTFCLVAAVACRSRIRKPNQKHA